MLSFPRHCSVNDLIPDLEADIQVLQIFLVSYTGIPEAIDLIMPLGKGACLQNLTYVVLIGCYQLNFSIAICLVCVWPLEALSINIASKEPILIVLSSHIWGSTWSWKHIPFQCVNMAVVLLLRRGSCKNRDVALLLRELTILVILHSFKFTAIHIPGARNEQADALSCSDFQLSLELSKLRIQFPSQSKRVSFSVCCFHLG